MTWYETGNAIAIARVSEGSGVSEQDVRKVMAALSEIGLIDYDVEKEIYHAYANGYEI